MFLPHLGGRRAKENRYSSQLMSVRRHKKVGRWGAVGNFLKKKQEWGGVSYIFNCFFNMSCKNYF